MTKYLRKKKDDDKIANPTRFYKHPYDVIKDTSLSHSNMVKSLENWLDDIKLKLLAEDENMRSTVSGPEYYAAEIHSLLYNFKRKDKWK